MSSAASLKMAKVRHRKRMFIAVVLIAIVAVSLLTYAVFAVYNFNLNIVKATAPAELQRGSQTQVAFIVKYDMMNNPLKNHITLSLSGTGAAWGSFVTANFFRKGTQTTPPPITISTPTDAAVLMIKIPSDAQTGSYEITVKGTNSIGITSSVNYAFTVT